MRGLLYILDDDGRPVACDDVEAWGFWMQSADGMKARTVAKDTDSAVTVSTVFLGVNHNHYHPAGEPILWETMVFGGPFHQEQHRYPSRADAEAGHRVVWQKVREVIAS